MSKLIYTLAFILLTTLVQAQTDNTAEAAKGDIEITVNIPNATSDKGKMMYALYQEKNFMGEPTLSTVETIKDKKSTTVFKGLAAGEYAVIVFHDANDNGIMDFDENQMPMEDFALSNNPKSFGPPQFINAKFTVSKTMTIEVKM